MTAPTAAPSLQAGASQARLAAAAEVRVAEWERLLAREREQARRHGAASTTERRVGRLLDAMRGDGWHLLADRRWPGTRANVDLLHVGPGGVFVIDVKAWHEPRIERGRLFRGQADADESIDSLCAVTSRVEEALVDHGLSPAQVVPLLVFTGRAGRMAPTPVGGVVALGEHQLVPWLTRRGHRIPVADTAGTAATLSRAFPPHLAGPLASAPTPEPAPVEQLELLDRDDLVASHVEAALARPVEEWMTYLHPAQLRVVRASTQGPSRVRGPAGTGKTVVALHRAEHLLRTHPGRLLFVTYVRTLPEVLAAHYARMSPHSASRVDFTGVHAFALRLLRERGMRVRLDAAAARQVFNRAWSRLGRHSALAQVPVHVDYWWEEVGDVIRGRALEDVEQYLQLRRVGRRTPLTAELRTAVWQLHLAYAAGLEERGLHDFADLLRLARDEVRRCPLDAPYRCVVVDEVQDLSMVGVQLVHALVGDAPDGLLLVGDGQQAVYPGGFTLAEAGISVPGARSTVLRTNYRNAAEVLTEAALVVATASFEDLDEHPTDGHGRVEVLRRGGAVVRHGAADVEAHDAALVEALRGAVTGTTGYGDCGVLTRTTTEAARYRRVLREAGVPVEDLADYCGSISGAVKVGTVKRAKGLEFKQVFLPRARRTTPQRVGEPDTAHAERAEREARELYVAMTRARDGLWVGAVDDDRPTRTPTPVRGRWGT